ncbi:hypothetical protein WB401_34715 [Streptomyces brasiliscabiei]|uniref:Integral membrane protein n=1 Tax=Streptomyces brasiliscabiei TaxID=2736302 RepID=A0ABU8GQ61_9ACTN
MRTFLEAATGFPTFFFTVPLLAAAGFWLLVAAGAVGPRVFDGDADLGALGLDGVPVAVAFSLWTGFAWGGSLGAVVLLEPSAYSGPSHALTGLAVLAVVPPLSWCATRAVVRAWKQGAGASVRLGRATRGQALLPGPSDSPMTSGLPPVSGPHYCQGRLP